jgi:excisionase family DNA binding protein
LVVADKVHTGTSDVFDIAGAAVFLGTSEIFVRRRIADGTLAAFRIRGSKLIRIRRADVEALMLPVNGCAL